MSITTHALGGLLAATLPAATPTPAVASAPAVGVGGTADTSTARVTRIVDGDTIVTTRGTIRLVGVDTPEMGRCNAAKATAKTRTLVPVGSRVTLTRPKGNNNKDRYGRWLRYVSRNGVDVGGALIKAGLADARYDSRYDSRDGYPRRAKQARYRARDARYPDKRCLTPSTAQTATPQEAQKDRGTAPTGVWSAGRRQVSQWRAHAVHSRASQ